MFPCDYSESEAEPVVRNMRCVAAGNTHQGMNELFPEARNAHCVAISACAISYGVLFSRHSMTTDNIDQLLRDGYNLYLRTKQAHNVQGDFLDPEELLTNFTVLGRNVEIEPMQFPLIQGVFPKFKRHFNAAAEVLAGQLQELLENSSENEGFLFTGLTVTVSFWKHGSQLFFFNSHGVDPSGMKNLRYENNNKARLFEFFDHISLAKTLLINSPYDRSVRAFAVHKVSVVNVPSCSNSSVSRITDNSDEKSKIDAKKKVLSSSPSDDSNILLHKSLTSTKSRKRKRTTVQKPNSGTNELFSTSSDENIVLPQDLQKPPVSSDNKKSDSVDPKPASQGSSFSDSALPLAERLINKPSCNCSSRKSVKNRSKATIQLSSFPEKEKKKRVKKMEKKSWGRPRTLNRRVWSKRTVISKKSSAIETIVSNDMELQQSHISIETVDSNTDVLAQNVEISVSASNRTAGRPPKRVRGPTKTSQETATKRHRDAVARYSQRNPQVHRDAARRYDQRNPEVNREAVQRYSEQNPEVHRDAARRYAEANSAVKRAAVATYRETNAERLARERNLPRELRGKGLLGKFSGPDLQLIKPYVLKKPSLLQTDIYRCPHCNAALFEEERTAKEWCCGQGRYANAPQHPKLEEPFYSVPDFFNHARQFNNIFAFSALGVSHGFQNPHDGIYFVKIQGRTYHRVFDLAYTDTTNPIGLYFDGGVRRSQLAQEQNLNEVVVEAISDYLNSVNPLINEFRKLHEHASEHAHLVFENTTRATHGPVLGDRPSRLEVAAIMDTDQDRFYPKKIVIWKIGGRKPHTVDMFHPMYESFQYPLLYPHGTPGWYIGITDNQGKKMSQVKYYRRLLLSEPQFTTLERLSQEWIVDMYCRVEEERLRFIQHSQKKGAADALRAAPAEELMQVVPPVRDETIEGGGEPKKGRVYLTNSFTGGPRYMKTKYMDGMALVSRKGKPSYFITMTCNPDWPEIKKSTLPGHQPSPVLCARVFKLKKQKLLQGLRDGSYFGKKCYILYVIEYQKRGLCHAHIAVRVENGPQQSSEIDEVVRADIPSEEEAGGRLRQGVLRHLVHGPCGHGSGHTTDLPCWDETLGKCTKFFPKPVTPTTYVDDQGFVHLKRNDKNVGIKRKGNTRVEVNDCWIVAYNATLLLEFDCHINVEIASTRKIVKYLFKYIMKGPDFAKVTILPGEEEDEIDEVEEYVTKRYIGACEAGWRICEFDITGREPNVIQLPVHLQDRQTVFFRQGGEGEALEQSTSNLILYFERPEGPEFDRLTYLDFYEKYRIETKRPRGRNVPVYEHRGGKHFYVARQRGEMVARMFWVPPSRGEQFFLRLLLGKMPARGYADLKAYGGEGCQTFYEAARALGLANDEEEYAFALAEAAEFMLGAQLRKFFVLLLLQGASGAMWEEFKHKICFDLIDRYDQNEQRAFGEALIQIGRQLRKHGSSLEEVGLPYVEDNSTELGRERFTYNLCETQLNDFVGEWKSRLSPEQQSLFDYIVHLSESQGSEESETKAMFVDGPAGTGKTLVLNVITAKLRAAGHVVLCAGTSGVVAASHEGGYTAHSLFKFPLDIPDEMSYWNITNGSQRAQLIREAKAIIFDEAPMMHKRYIHMLDRSLRDLMQCDIIFGGKIVIFAGDFRQIPPVVVTARLPSDVISASMRTSHLWPELKKFSLTQAQRTRGDDAYSGFLLCMGNGELPGRTVGEGKDKIDLVAVPEISYVTHIDQLIEFAFPDEILENPDECAKRAILSMLNVNVREINNYILRKHPAEEINLFSADYLPQGETANEFLLGTDSLNIVEGKGVPSHHLVLKKGAVCFITRNLCFEQRLLNGTKVIVISASKRIVQVRKPGQTEVYYIPRIVFKMPVDKGSPQEMCRRQFPLQVAYAMTVNKSQGQTIDRLALDLRSDAFSHGQAYVAFGRVRDSNSIQILISEDRVIDGVPHIRNVVYNQLLR